MTTRQMTSLDSRQLELSFLKISASHVLPLQSYDPINVLFFLETHYTYALHLWCPKNNQRLATKHWKFINRAVQCIVQLRLTDSNMDVQFACVLLPALGKSKSISRKMILKQKWFDWDSTLVNAVEWKMCLINPRLSTKKYVLSLVVYQPKTGPVRPRLSMKNECS